MSVSSIYFISAAKVVTLLLFVFSEKPACLTFYLLSYHGKRSVVVYGLHQRWNFLFQSPSSRSGWKIEMLSVVWFIRFNLILDEIEDLSKLSSWSYLLVQEQLSISFKHLLHSVIRFCCELYFKMKFFGGFFGKAMLLTMALCACVTLRVHGDEVQLNFGAVRITIPPTVITWVDAL